MTDHSVSRRTLFRAAGAGAAVLGGGALLDACSSGIQGASSSSTPTSTSTSSSTSTSTASAAATGSLTIGWIHPVTGSLAGFGYPDHWVIQQIMATPQFKNGMKIGGTTYSVTCTCPSRMCACSTNGQPSGMAPFGGCTADCTGWPVDEMFQGCGFPEP